MKTDIIILQEGDTTDEKQKLQFKSVLVISTLTLALVVSGNLALSGAALEESYPAFL